MDRDIETRTKKPTSPRLLLPIVVVAGLLLSSCDEVGVSKSGPEPPPHIEASVTAAVLPALPTGWEWHVSSQHGYRIGYPATWDKDTPALGMISFVDPRTGVGIDVGVAATRQTNLKTYVEANKIPTAEGATYSHQGPITINGVQGYEMILTIPSEFFGRIFRPHILKHRQVVFLSQGKAYVMTATALEDEYNAYSDIFDSFVASFIVPKP